MNIKFLLRKEKRTQKSSGEPKRALDQKPQLGFKRRLEFWWCRWILMNPLLQHIQLFLFEKTVAFILKPFTGDIPKRSTIKKRKKKKNIQFLSLLWSGFAPLLFRDVEFRPVENLEELLAASRLTYKAYLKQGLQKPNFNQIRLRFHQLLPHSTTFVAIYRRQHILGTITLVEDSPVGLPMEKNYRQELNGLRKKDHHLAEATLLAFDNVLLDRLYSSSHRVAMLVRFIKSILDFIQGCTRLNDIVACFHPRHRYIYEFLEWKSLGGLTSYAAARGNLAIAKHIYLPETIRKAKRHIAYRFFFGNSESPEKFKNRLRLTFQDIQNLLELEPHLLESATPSQLKYLIDRYPTLHLPKIPLEPHSKNPLTSGSHGTNLSSPSEEQELKMGNGYKA